MKTESGICKLNNDKSPGEIRWKAVLVTLGVVVVFGTLGFFFGRMLYWFFNS
ncbi:hypothetical protein [Robiginitalea marina]|uniref:Protein translocase SEC61 complex subunit gamma n=1 Tax=Robiginitalea marina TaxID=2954105 RepID=A0ABT1AZT3_9FLAO|nr:hypothetical protein [Robiginitalea marina]MCO5725204.1 hypothetical protein [Robiginitalea marina]